MTCGDGAISRQKACVDATTSAALEDPSACGTAETAKEHKICSTGVECPGKQAQ